MFLINHKGGGGGMWEIRERLEDTAMVWADRTPPLYGYLVLHFVDR